MFENVLCIMFYFFDIDLLCENLILSHIRYIKFLAKDQKIIFNISQQK